MSSLKLVCCGAISSSPVPPGDVLVFTGALSPPAVAWLTSTAVSGAFAHKFALGPVAAADEPTLMRARVTVLVDASYSLFGLWFFGTPWQPAPLGAPAHAAQRGRELSGKWHAIPLDTDVLITRCAPGTAAAAESSSNACADLTRSVCDRSISVHVFGAGEDAGDDAGVDVSALPQGKVSFVNVARRGAPVVLDVPLPTGETPSAPLESALVAIPPGGHFLDVWPVVVFEICMRGDGAGGSFIGKLPFVSLSPGDPATRLVAGALLADCGGQYVSLAASRGVAKRARVALIDAASTTIQLLRAHDFASGAFRLLAPMTAGDGSRRFAHAVCLSATGPCFGVVCDVPAIGALAAYVDALSNLLAHPSASLDESTTPSISVALAVHCIRRDSDAQRLLIECDAGRKPTLFCGLAAPLIDTPLASDDGLLTCVKPAELLKLLAMLILFDMPIGARHVALVNVFVHGARLDRVGRVMVQLITLIEPLFNFIGSVGITSDANLPATLGLRDRSVFGMTTSSFAACAGVAREHHPDEAPLDAIVAIDVDQRTIRFPTWPALSKLVDFPGADGLRKTLEALLGANLLPLEKGRAIQNAVQGAFARMLVDDMKVAAYASGGDWRADQFVAQECGKGSKWQAFRCAFARSPLLLETFLSSSFLAPAIESCFRRRDTDAFERIWRGLHSHTKAKMYAITLGSSKTTLLHVACEEAFEHAIEVLLRDAHLPRDTVLQADATGRLPTFYLARAASTVDVAQASSAIERLLRRFLTVVREASDPISNVASPLYVAERTDRNVTMLMTAVKSGANVVGVLVDALRRIPRALALQVLTLANADTLDTALHIATRGRADPQTIALLLAALRDLAPPERVDDVLLAALSAVSYDGRTPLHSAARCPAEPLLTLMLTPLVDVRHRHPQRVSALLLLLAGESDRSKSGATILDDCVGTGNHAGVRALANFLVEDQPTMLQLWRASGIGGATPLENIEAKRALDMLPSQSSIDFDELTEALLFFQTKLENKA